jgi:maltose-binding protein MalE
VFEEGVSLTLYLKHDGYEPAVVFVPEEGRKAARIVRKLKPKGGLGEPAVPQAPSGAAPTVEAPATAIEPGTAPDSTLPESGAQSVISPVVTAPTVGEPLEPRADAGEPAARGTAPLRGAAFRVDPAIGNDPFFKEMARQFARQAPGFSLVTGPGSANLDAAAWPRGADVVGGIDKASEFTYERLPQLVAAKLVRPLDGWFEWTQLSPALVEAVRVGGKVYGVPIGGSSPILYYNRDLVGEAPGSWAEIGTLREMLAPNGGETLVMPMNSTFHMGMFVESRGVSLLVPDTVRSGLGTPQAGRAYDAMQEALQETGSPRGLEYDQALALFRERKAALFVDGPQSFSGLRAALGNSLGVATLPSWGTPPVAMRPYANVLSLFVSSSVNDDQAAILKRFFRFLLEEKSQLELCLIRLKMGTPIAPALRLQEGETVRRIREETVVSALYRQLETAVPMPRGPLAGDAWWVFGEVLAGLQRREPGQVLADMAAARFVLYGLEKKQVPAGGGELRAVIDPPEKSQGLFFRPWNKEDKGDEESDLRFVELGGSRGVVSIRNLGTLVDRGELSYVYLVVSYAPYRAGKAPPLRGQIEYFDEPNATLRIVYDSKDASVREDPQHPGAFKEARVIQCRGTRTWQTAEFPILDARFDGWCAGADLRIEVVAKGKIPAVRAVVLTPVK